MFIAGANHASQSRYAHSVPVKLPLDFYLLVLTAGFEQ